MLGAKHVFLGESKDVNRVIPEVIPIDELFRDVVVGFEGQNLTNYFDFE